MSVKTKPCVLYIGAQAIMRLAGLLLLLQVILLQFVAAVAATLTQVTGPLSLKPAVTGAHGLRGPGWSSR